MYEGTGKTAIFVVQSAWRDFESLPENAEEAPLKLGMYFRERGIRFSHFCTSLSPKAEKTGLCVLQGCGQEDLFQRRFQYHEFSSPGYDRELPSDLRVRLRDRAEELGISVPKCFITAPEFREILVAKANRAYAKMNILARVFNEKATLVLGHSGVIEPARARSWDLQPWDVDDEWFLSPLDHIVFEYENLDGGTEQIVSLDFPFADLDKYTI